MCSNAHAVHCWTSVGWKNIQLCCLLPSDVSAGPAVLPEEIPKEIYNLDCMESNCIVVLLILLCRNIGRLWTPAFGLLCETFKLQCGQCCCCSFLGLQCAISWTIWRSLNNLCLNCTSNTKTNTKKSPTCPMDQHLRGHISLLPLCPGGYHLMLFSNELLPCWWAVFSGEREVRKNPTVLSHFSQCNHDKTS